MIWECAAIPCDRIMPGTHTTEVNQQPNKLREGMSILSWLDREHIVASPGFNRWLVPPAALCVHLCIGQVYAFSVFNLPMTKLIGITQSAPGDWKLTELGWIFSIAILVLGIASALTGSWLDRVGPR